MRPIVCVQRPGDVLYLPAAWHHATINIGETVALASQTNRLLGRRRQQAAAAADGPPPPPLSMDSSASGSSGSSSSSRQEVLMSIEAAGPSSELGLSLLRELRVREPGNIDTLTRLVTALLAAPDVEAIANANHSSHQKHTKKNKKKAKKHAVPAVGAGAGGLQSAAAAAAARKAAVREVHVALHELDQLQRSFAKSKSAATTTATAAAVNVNATASYSYSTDDSVALQVRCCALLTDLAQYKAATNCLDEAAATTTGSRHTPKLYFEKARVALRFIERAMRRGEDVVRSQVEPIANHVRMALELDSTHRGARELEQILMAPPPGGLGWEAGL